MSFLCETVFATNPLFLYVQNGFCLLARVIFYQYEQVITNVNVSADISKQQSLVAWEAEVVMAIVAKLHTATALVH